MDNAAFALMGLRPTGADLWRWWLAAAALGALGTPVVMPLVGGLLDAVSLDPVFVAMSGLMLSLLSGLGIGVLVALLQWRGLQRDLPHLAAWEWIGATLLGGLLGWPASLCQFGVPYGPTNIGETMLVAGVSGALGGAALGLAQWLVLRRWVARAGWWILARALVGGGTGSAAALLFKLRYLPDDSPPATDLLAMIPYAAAHIGVAGLGVVGLVLVLLWLLRQTAAAATTTVSQTNP